MRRALTSPEPWVRATANWAHNFTLVEQGDLDGGARAREEAVRGFEEVGDRWGLVMSLLAIGRVPALRGEYATSIAAFERAVAISAELGTEDYLYWTRNRLARERMRGGDLDGAWRDLRAMQDRAEQLGQRRREAAILFSVAGWQRRAGELDASERTLDTLETQVDRLPYPEQMARDLIAGTRMMNRLAARAAADARKLLPERCGPTSPGTRATGSPGPPSRSASCSRWRTGRSTRPPRWAGARRSAVPSTTASRSSARWSPTSSRASARTATATPSNGVPACPGRTRCTG